MSSVKCQVSSVKCQVSSVKCQVSSIKCQVSSVKCQVSSVKCQNSTLSSQGLKKPTWVCASDRPTKKSATLTSLWSIDPSLLPEERMYWFQARLDTRLLCPVITRLLLARSTSHSCTYKQTSSDKLEFQCSSIRNKNSRFSVKVNWRFLLQK